MGKLRSLAIVFTLLAALLMVQSASAAVTLGNGDFEDGPAIYWSESSTSGYDLVTTYGGYAHTGSWYAWLGADAGSDEKSVISQSFKMPKKGTVVLEFWLYIAAHDAAGGDKLKVVVDGDKLLTIQETDSAYTGGYAQLAVDLSAYVDGGTHTLKIQGTDKVGANTSWRVDDVELNLEALTNNSFETDSNSDNVPDGWKIVSPSGLTRRVCNESHTGSCSVRLRGDGATEQLIYVWKPGPTGKAGDIFYFWGFAKGDSVPAGQLLKVFATSITGVESLVYSLPIPDGTYDWDGGGASWAIPFDYKKLRLVVEHTAASGTLWVDDLSLSQAGGPVPAP